MNKQELLKEIDDIQEEIFWLNEIENINICDFMSLMDDLLDSRTQYFAMLDDIDKEVIKKNDIQSALRG
jgi:hypothetical protein